jgi:hypothetical protein
MWLRNTEDSFNLVLASCRNTDWTKTTRGLGTTCFRSRPIATFVPQKLLSPARFTDFFHSVQMIKPDTKEEANEDKPALDAFNMAPV